MLLNILFSFHILFPYSHSILLHREEVLMAEASLWHGIADFFGESDDDTLVKKLKRDQYIQYVIDQLDEEVKGEFEPKYDLATQSIERASASADHCQAAVTILNSNDRYQIYHDTLGVPGRYAKAISEMIIRVRHPIFIGNGLNTRTIEAAKQYLSRWAAERELERFKAYVSRHLL